MQYHCLSAKIVTDDKACSPIDALNTIFGIITSGTWGGIGLKAVCYSQ